MNNRTLVLLTSLVLLAMFVLFAVNLTDILKRQPPDQTFLKYNDIQGIAVKRNELLYTLNFNQQNKVIEILNFAVPVTEIKSGKREPANIRELVIYPLEGKPEIVLTAIAYVDNDLIFSAPAWVPNGYLMELSEGNLKTLLSQTYD